MKMILCFILAWHFPVSFVMESVRFDPAFFRNSWLQRTLYTALDNYLTITMVGYAACLAFQFEMSTSFAFPAVLWLLFSPLLPSRKADKRDNNYYGCVYFFFPFFLSRSYHQSFYLPREHDFSGETRVFRWRCKTYVDWGGGAGGS